MELDFAHTGSFEKFVAEMRRNFTPEFRNQAALTIKVSTMGLLPSKCSLILMSCGQTKIQVIKAVRQITRLGLKEAKDLVESAPAPVLEDVVRDAPATMDAMVMLEEAGAKAILQ